MPLDVYLGIDPGWKNLGFSMAQYDTETTHITLLHSQVFNISGYKGITPAIKDIVATFIRYKPDNAIFRQLTIERFISYKNVDSAEFEIINRIIGALDIYFNEALVPTYPTRLERAIDWKTSLVKALHIKSGFENPSETLDKKFSIAAGKACLDEVPGKKMTDHEYDAVCLACMPIFCKK